MDTTPYDCAIIGGGVAGLSLAILLAQSNQKVILFEKEQFPFHKVCGEYISNESIPFLTSLGINFSKQALPDIDKLLLTSPSGISIRCPLSIGGTGLSRYELDAQLYAIAVNQDVDVHTKTKVEQVKFDNNLFEVCTANERFYARTAVGAFGKNTNIDVQLKRTFRATKQSNLYIAVKYHIYADFFDRTQVEMHNFSGGYCGLSAIEDNKVNMSYISKVQNLKKAGSIPQMEKTILSKNPHLKQYLERGTFLFDKPLTISHLYFGMKNTTRDHLLLLGDAAGNIAPLSGNGMSMALQSAKLAYECLLPYLKQQSTWAEMEKQYTKAYYHTFSKRIWTAKQINRASLYTPLLTDITFSFLRLFPAIVKKGSAQIHGDVF
ncbi:NAD(P)/FAD-dependent oxidoreductase [Myroides sp. DW712]|uniref:NAD(P)/FAD-dependent oxidoreductase n=1 Tax=Myroides sp. DW712 TaxID=3389800 RepID=UPI00397D149C